MRDINKVILVGRIGADPTRKETQNGNVLSRFSLATTRTVEDRKETSWHRIVVWGKQAENCAQYLRKGEPVLVEGSIRMRDFQDTEGRPRTAYEIHANSVSYLGGAKRRKDELAVSTSEDSTLPTSGSEIIPENADIGPYVPFSNGSTELMQ